MAKQTPLYEAHVADGAKLVDFAGWDMPIDYGSQISEHNAVRESVGMFDVSHMAVADISGGEVREFLRWLLANDVAKIDEAGRALYTCMLNTRGGVIDDLIVYHLSGNLYRIVVNAATTEKDLAWIDSQSRDYDVAINHRQDLAIIAVQGPRGRDIAAELFDDEFKQAALKLKPFRVAVQDDRSIGRTGYTGEDGFELVLPADEAVSAWKTLRDKGVAPIGLGARDTLRLEAGLNLYGQDMDEDRTPLESGLAWTVAFEPEERDFVGRSALEHMRAEGVAEKLVGLVLEGRGVMRSETAVRAADSDVEEKEAEGEITSGSYSPTLSCSIALARVPVDWEESVEVCLRGKWQRARIVRYPFVRHGKSRIDD
ncbi:Aminomethyltransferase protein [Salinisphaera shabanensis E1L3A]|uniref:Aminomethyltransferase n=1 Tax=Salinisphaera shabanensis E1L3A TaxID=1033802 RepID=U2ES28_9GAMM|nr:glycine cleavage system aminomethyltransferase GcvT [Salinisphaera shabanensis]ERJ20797.1 Aminomethyltransferase protein [Salinisphaera shabanensis E1L3A]